MARLKILSVFLIVGFLIGAGFFALGPGSDETSTDRLGSGPEVDINAPEGNGNDNQDQSGIAGTSRIVYPVDPQVNNVNAEENAENIDAEQDNDAEVETDIAGNPLLHSGYLTENDGQFPDENVKFFGKFSDMQVGFGESAVYYQMEELPDIEDLESRSEVSVSGVFLMATFNNANAVMPQGINELGHKSNYILGSDPEGWHTEVSNYGGVVFEDLYEGIDLEYIISADGLKYNFNVHPGADPDVIEISFDGADSVNVVDGDLVLSTPMGDIVDSAPYSYQDQDQVVGSAFELRGESSYGFSISDWDTSTDLVIDPLVYSTYLGGDHQDYTRNIVVDASNNAYVVGTTWAHANPFPTTTGAYQTTHAGGVTDAFVTKLNANGSALIFSTFLGGGTNGEEGFAIAIDSSNNVYAGGRTTSTDFPTTTGAFDTTFGGGTSMDDGWVAKLNPAGSTLLFSTYLGGGGDDEVRDLEVDSSGNVFITGYGQGGYPTTTGAYDTTFGGGVFRDAIATKLNASGSALDYSTYIGGPKHDAAVSIEVDSSGNAYVFGETESNNFPNTTGALDNTLGGSRDNFITKVNPSGSALVYSTYLGGSAGEGTGDIAIDSSGNVYATGLTGSSDFYNTTGAFDNTYNGANDLYALKLNTAGSALVYSTFIGGSGQDWGRYMTVDGSGQAHIQGAVISTDFPTTSNAYSNVSAGGQDIMIIVVSASGDSLLYSSYFGSSAHDGTSGITLDSSGNVYITGSVSATDFPITSGAYDTVLNSGTSTISDAYVSKLALNLTDDAGLIDDAQDIIDYLDGMDPGDFSNPNHQKTLKNKMNAVMKMIEDGNYCAAANKLENDLLKKLDGEHPPPDWVTDPVHQQALEDMILDLIDELRAKGGC